ncbi:MAG: GNAT family N-acetyltransferase [Gammaproteobacteria bacterium]|nr:GNAT family N-acetyltransferase [Gammaproteobacteria bacterium]
MRTAVVKQIRDIPPADWNRVSGTAHPFLRYEFLSALESNGCVGDTYGWWPRHIVAYDADGTLVGIAPLYLKNNSYGEFVFDWAWADAYHRASVPYYPKLVSAIPYTPVTGPRLLVHPASDHAQVSHAIIDRALSLVTAEQASSLHWLFTTEADTTLLCDNGFLRRSSCHFHWHNAGYASFDDFLSRLSSRKRKKIRRERRHVQEAGIDMHIVHGNEATPEQWRIMHAFYCSTFEKKSGVPTLSLGFFQEISRTMGEQVVLVFASQGGDTVAGAIMLRGADALYGRHWGCREEFNSLHFEACYYQGIDYCIRNHLGLFEPGAQGEHKISRGFLPVYTWSAHWIVEERFRMAIKRYLQEEHELIVGYHDDLMETSPYRKTELDDA